MRSDQTFVTAAVVVCAALIVGYGGMHARLAKCAIGRALQAHGVDARSINHQQRRSPVIISVRTGRVCGRGGFISTIPSSPTADGPRGLKGTMCASLALTHNTQSTSTYRHREASEAVLARRRQDGGGRGQVVGRAEGGGPPPGHRPRRCVGWVSCGSRSIDRLLGRVYGIGIDWVIDLADQPRDGHCTPTPPQTPSRGRSGPAPWTGPRCCCPC